MIVDCFFIISFLHFVITCSNTADTILTEFAPIMHCFSFFLQCFKKYKILQNEMTWFSYPSISALQMCFASVYTILQFQPALWVTWEAVFNFRSFFIHLLVAKSVDGIICMYEIKHQTLALAFKNAETKLPCNSTKVLPKINVSTSFSKVETFSLSV